MSLRKRFTRGFIFGFILTVLAVTPFLVSAADMRSSEGNLTVGKDEVINNDLYISSGYLSIEGTVNGDVIAFGGQVRITGDVNGDIIVAGGQVSIEGNISDDARVAGGNVTLRGSVGDDLVVAAGNIELARGSEVRGDTYAFSGQSLFAGTNKNIQVNTGNLTIAGSSMVNGNVDYISGSDANIEKGSVITGQVNKQIVPDRVSDRAVLGIFTLAIILSLLITLIMALIFVWVFPNKTVFVANDWRDHFGINLITGLIFLIVAPITSVLLILSVVGAPLGIISLLAFCVLLYLGHLAGIISLGSLIVNRGGRSNITRLGFGAVITGVILYAILSVIPFIGWILALIIFLVGLGALLRFDWFNFLRLRKEKIL